jgi:putative tryptophan/tyrosine transport system substrate-binding protein
MRRRDFAGLLLGAAAAGTMTSSSSSAQPRTRRIGFLTPASATVAEGFVEELRAGLREQGLTDGEHVRVEVRVGDTPEALQEAAEELVRSRPDLIVAWSSPAVRAVQRLTTTVPIVMVGIADPVGSRFVASLARPGGNITGSTNLSRDLSGKILDFLLQIVPQMRRVGILLNPSNEAATLQLRDTEVAAHTLGLELHLAEAVAPDGLVEAISKLAQQRVTALVGLADPLFTTERARLADLGLVHRLPSAFARRENAEAGALIAYGPNLKGQFRRAAGYTVKLLSGAVPVDLPVEQPTHLELVLNLKTARLLDLAIPPSLLVRADEVIE